MKTRTTVSVAIGVAAVAGIAFFFLHGRPDPQTSPAGGRRGMDPANRPVPVQAAAVRRGDIDVVIDALGTVTARNTTTVKARVDGQLIRIDFREGQPVRQGQVLAEIDPRPFQVALDQANGQLLRDQALLANAKLDLARYQGLLAKDSIAKQQVDAQGALVQQYEGTVKTDQAQVDSARLNLGFTRITAPVSGRLGLRQVDAGNMVHASDANGIVVITQTQPIAVVFAIPADDLAEVIARLREGKSLAVDAYDREGKTKLATGKLLTVDNQIDTSTGTVKLKAEFANADNALFPNQFVNARLKVETLHDAVLAPTAAVQRGTPGTFVYVVGADRKVGVRPVVLGPVSGETVAVDKGLQAGEQVVTDGADKLRQGATVEVAAAGGTTGPAAAARGAGRHKPGSGPGGGKEATARAGS